MTNQPLSYRGLVVGGLIDLSHAALADEGSDGPRVAPGSGGIRLPDLSA